MISTQDLLIILIIVLVLYGKKRIRDIAKGTKDGIRNFKNALSEPDEINVTPKERKDTTPARSREKRDPLTLRKKD